MRTWKRVRLSATRLRWLAFLILLIVVAGATLMPSAAEAALLAEERFLTSATPAGPEYAIGSLAGQNRNVLGFAGEWFTSVGASPTANATSLNYGDANFPAETGGRMLSPTGDSRIHRLLSPASNPFESTDAGTAYMSFLLQTGTNNGYRAFEMHNGGISDGDHRTLQIGLHNGGDFPLPNNFGFRVNNNGGLEFALGAENGNANLFLVRFDLTTVNNADRITVWHNPNISSLASDPAGGVVATGFNFAADRLGAGHFGGSQYGFDELRIGTTLEDVLTDSLYCDVNGNGVCNSSDTRIISDHMFLAGSFADGDVDSSGVVDFADFRLFKDHPARVVGFDPEGFGSFGVPEPASALLLGLAILWCGGLFGRGGRRRNGGCRALVLIVVVLVSGAPVHAADVDLLNDVINFSGKTLEFRPYATMPGGFNNIIGMTYKPSDTRMYVTTEQGSIFAINENTSGNTSAALWFDAAAALQSVTGRSMSFGGSQQGLQSVAFHPDFENVGAPGFGKLYTTMLESRPGNPSDSAFFYLGNSTYGGGGADGVLAEWTYDHSTGQVDSSSYRELFRTNMPVYDHPIKQARFNPYAEPGDEDYGLLYMTHGDSNGQSSLNDDPQDRGDVLGKMLRINPLQSGGDRYTIPATNPYYNVDGPSPSGTAVLGEVYAYGMRNPHTFSFNPDDDGNIQILVGDIGRSNMEEINLIVPGGNYGWTKREGTFVHLQGDDYTPPGVNAGYITGVEALPANEAAVGVGPDGNRYIFPVGQYDHNGNDVVISQDYTATSVASGFVIRNGSDPTLHNQFVFHNFAFNHGDVYHIDFDEALNAVTQLDPDDPTRDEPSELQPAELFRFHLSLDHDNNPNTPPQTSDNINNLLGTFRNDGRYGEGVSGEMYVSTKSGAIYLVTNTVPDNRLTLTVDRGSGEMTITNATGSNIEVDRVSVFSPTGSLAPSEFQSIEGGWTVSPTNNTRSLTQSNDGGSLELTDMNSAFVGAPYDPQLVAFGEPPGEDIQFVFSTAGPTGRSFVGDVAYTGESDIPNTIVLTVDVASGEASMLNQTPFSQEVEGYTISSAGSINAAGWESFESQGIDDGDWFASPPLDTRLTEVQGDGTTTFDEQTAYSLGDIYQTGADQDLVFEFLLAGEGSLREGMVAYILAGDYNDNGVVDAADYTTWRDNLGSGERLANDMTPGDVGMDDYSMWKQNFGAVWPEIGSGAAANSLSAVPEPATCWLVMVAAAAFTLNRSPRRNGQISPAMTSRELPAIC